MDEHGNYVVRNREQQRRSRARKKDYVADLEERVRKYDQDGLKVIAEVQVAARRVAEENQALRALLGVHGVSAAGIDYHLASSRQVTAATCSSAIHPIPYSRSPRPLAAEQRPLHPISRSSQQVYELPTPSASHSPSEEYRSPSPPESPGPLTSESHYSAPDFDTPLDSAVVIGEASPAKAADETSYEKAARVITSMRGHEDPETFKSALGCSGSDKCMVKNIEIFHLADG